QAEDGIRDSSVTGVQTCALPISGQPAGSKPPVPGEEREEEYGHAHCGSDLVARPEAVHQTLQCPDRHLEQGCTGARTSALAGLRSEERRVGKECRYRSLSSSEGP